MYAWPQGTSTIIIVYFKREVNFANNYYTSLKFLDCNGFSDHVFVDSCKAVLQRCIFLLLGVQTSFPVNQENLDFLQSVNKTPSNTSLSRDVGSGSQRPSNIAADTPSSSSLSSQV